MATFSDSDSSEITNVPVEASSEHTPSRSEFVNVLVQRLDLCTPKKMAATSTSSSDSESCKTPEVIPPWGLLLSSSEVFDSHCHLDRVVRKKLTRDNNFTAEFLTKIIETDFGSNFAGCITSFCFTDCLEHGLIFTILEHSKVWASIGCHPKNSLLFGSAMKDFIVDYAKKSRKMVAIGEIGLDGTCVQEIPLESQKGVFEELLKVALEVEKPLCLHVRGDFDVNVMAREIMKEVGVPRTWPFHLHCFSNTWEVLQEWLQEWPACKVGIVGRRVGLHSWRSYEDLIEKIPLDRLLLETDSPYLGLHPGTVLNVAERVARVKKMDINKVLSINRENIESVYKLRESLPRKRASTPPGAIENFKAKRTWISNFAKNQRRTDEVTSLPQGSSSVTSTTKAAIPVACTKPVIRFRNRIAKLERKEREAGPKEIKFREMIVQGRNHHPVSRPRKSEDIKKSPSDDAKSLDQVCEHPVTRPVNSEGLAKSLHRMVHQKTRRANSKNPTSTLNEEKSLDQILTRSSDVKDASAGTESLSAIVANYASSSEVDSEV